jgi:hypothetical protein
MLVKPIKLITCLICFLFLIHIGIAGDAFAQTVAPGVSPGDHFVYYFTFSWTSTDPDATIPSNLLYLNETEYICITIADIKGALISMNVTRKFKNGTEGNPSQIFVHILNGVGDGFGLIIAPNLEPNSLVYPYGKDYGNSFSVNEMMVKSYQFGEREVLHCRVNKTDHPDYLYVYYDLYYDRKTGVMLEWVVEQVPDEEVYQKISLSWKIKDFNINTVQDSSKNEVNEPSFLNLAVVVIGVALIAILFIYKKKKSLKRKHYKQSS